MPTSARPNAQKAFDYTGLDAETSQFVQQQTGEIRALMKRTAQSIVEVGQRLSEVKGKLGHGFFLNWLEAEFEWTHETARRFMTVAQQFGQSPHIVEFAPTALYILAAPSTSNSARTEAIARAEAGEPITYAAAKALKKKYAAPAKARKSGLKPKPEPEVEPETEPPVQTEPQPSSTPTPPLQSGSKLEIVSIRPQAQVPALETAGRVVVPQTAQTLLAAQLPVYTTDGTHGIWWDLRGRHRLYCGDPNSSEFVGRVTEEVSLLVAFPPSPDWRSAIRAKTSLMVGEYLPPGKTLDQLDDFLESTVLFNTKLGALVISCFLPSQEILSIVNRLERRGLFAEPDEQRCKVLVADWKRAGLKVERLG